MKERVEYVVKVHEEKREATHSVAIDSKKGERHHGRHIHARVILPGEHEQKKRQNPFTFTKYLQKKSLSFA